MARVCRVDMRAAKSDFDSPAAACSAGAFLSFQQITKRFPGVLALNQVSFEIQRGSCHALMGENGAGKSTLGKILAGVYVADEGQILLHGNALEAPTPLAARKLGIAMVHQELAF